MAGILLRLVGPFLTKAARTNSLKDAGTNLDHFSKNFPHGRVYFVYLGGLIVFRMETLVISAWQLEVTLYCCSFSSRVFNLGYFTVWSNLGICRYG